MNRGFIPKPHPRLAVQDHRGERWLVVYVDTRVIRLNAIPGNPRFAEPDPILIMTTERWNRAFGHEGWMAV